MGSGSTGLLSPVKLIQRTDVQKVLSTLLSELTAFAQKKTIKMPTITVVGDSLTVRKVTCRLLGVKVEIC